MGHANLRRHEPAGFPRGIKFHKNPGDPRQWVTLSFKNNMYVDAEGDNKFWALWNAIGWAYGRRIY